MISLNFDCRTKGDCTIRRLCHSIPDVGTHDTEDSEQRLIACALNQGSLDAVGTKLTK